MKILRDVPEILTPSMVMDAKMNWHVTFPLLDSRDFLMYGKTMILNESGTMNENISNCLIFMTEMVYAMEMDRYGIGEFWDDKVLKGAIKSSAPIIGGKAWQYIILSTITKDYRFHLSNTIWRRKLRYKDNGTITPIGVYPDKETIPAHNIGYIFGMEREIPLSKDIADKAGYPSLKNREFDFARDLVTFFYYNPLPRLEIESEPNTTDFYIEFYDKCDMGIYKWMERIMSALMLRSADSVFAARDMAAVSYLEKWPDESSFPDGDVFMVENTRPVEKLINILKTLPEGALYPNPTIWAASSCERYPEEEIEKQIKAAVSETSVVFKSDYERSANEAVLNGSISNMTPRAARIVDLINGNPDVIDPEKAELLKDCVAEDETRLLRDIGMDGEWEIDRDTARLVRKQAAILNVKPGATAPPAANGPAGAKMDDILEKAFVDTDMLAKKEMVKKAFLEPDHVKTPEAAAPPRNMDPAETPRPKDGIAKKGTDAASYLDGLLDSAFIDKE